jgi:hypothetical protein
MRIDSPQTLAVLLSVRDFLMREKTITGEN